MRRYKRFFADIEAQEGRPAQPLIAHCPNTGSMKALIDRLPAPCRYSFSDNPKRKLKYTLEQIKVGNSWVGVHTGRPNRLVWDCFEQGLLPHWAGAYDGGRAEVKINDKSRIDLVLWRGRPDLENMKRWDPQILEQGPLHFVEVKNTTLVEPDGYAYFPDSVTERGQKHIRELMDLMDQGHTCELVFTIQRTDAAAFRAARHIDPKYAELLNEATQRGLKVTPLVFEPTELGINYLGVAASEYDK